MLVIARALVSSLFRALRSPPDKGVGWYFGAIRHPSAERLHQRSGGLCLETWPTPVVLVAAGSLLACIVQQPLPDLLPDRFPTVEAYRIDGLDFYGALAAAARDAQHVTLDI